MPCGREGNRRSGVAVAMRPRLQRFIHIWDHGLMEYGTPFLHLLEFNGAVQSYARNNKTVFSFLRQLTT